MATKTYRVAVLVEGRKDKIVGPASADKSAAEAELRKITEAQQRGTDAVVALRWLSVRENAITAAYVEERWTGSAPKVGSPSIEPRERFKD